MADFSIEIPVGMDISQVNAALKKFNGNVQETAKYLTDLSKSTTGDTRLIGVQFVATDSLSPAFKATETSSSRAGKAYAANERQLKQLTKTVRGSVTSLRQSIAARKQQLAGIRRTDSAYQHVEKTIKSLQKALNKAQGIEEGSVAAKRQLLSSLQRQADALRQGSEEQRRYAREVKKLTAEINNTNNPFSRFFGILNRLATLQAGFQAFTAIVGGFFGKINEFTGQQKQLEGFELALKNVGLSTVEASKALGEASSISARLGAPLQQVEKSFKRMVPSLRAVGVNAEDSSKFIEGIAARTQTLGLNTEQSGRFVEAFAQVLSKGKLQAEELNQQISELDGAFRTQLADALGVATSELEELISNGEITAKVFVKAFNEMENGAEELAKRVKEGNLTVQQFENIIDKIRTENIRNLGKLLQPAILGFLELQLASEQFIATVIDSEFGKFLVDVFNNVVLGIRDFATILINTTKALGFFLEPLFATTRFFSGLLRLIVPLAAGFVTLKVATFAYGASVTFASNALVPFIANLVKTAIQATISTAALIKLAAVNFAQGIAGWSVALLEFIKTLVLTRGNLAAAGTELKVYTALQGKASAAALAGVAKFGALAGVALLVASAFVKYKTDSKEAKKVTEEINILVKESTERLKEENAELQKKVDLLMILKRIGAFGEAIIFGTTGIGQTEEFRSTAQSVLNLTEQFNKFAENAKINFKDLKGVSDDTFVKLLQDAEDATAATQALLEKIPELKKEAKGNADALMLLEIDEKRLRENLALLKDQLGSLREEKKSRKELTKEIENNIKSLEEYNKKRKEAEEFQDTAALALEVKLLKQYGDTAKDAADKNLILSAAEAFRHEGNVKQLQEELKLIKEKDAKAFGGEEEKRKLVEQVTKDILINQKKQMEAAKNFADIITAEVERVFKESSDAAQNYLDIANQVTSAVNKVRSTIGTTISTLKTASNIVFDNMLPGASPQKQKEIERSRLLTAARINEIEHKITQIKLKTAFRMQQIETQVMQARLRGEAAIARRRGDEAGAQNLERSANSLNEILRLNEMNYNMERRNLYLQKRIKDERLVQQAMSTKIGDQEVQLFSNYANRTLAIEQTNRALGTQGLKLGDIKNTMSEIDTQTEALELFDEKALASGENGLVMQVESIGDINSRVKEMQGNFMGSVDSNESLLQGLGNTQQAMSRLTAEGQNYNKELEKAVGNIENIRNAVSRGTAARWMGGPVEGGQTYRVNDAGLGREAFMNKFGNISMLPAGSNINWTAPSSGTIIPAAIVKQLSKNTEYNSQIADSNAKTIPTRSAALGRDSGMDSGNLVKQMTAAIGASGGNQRITNNVTIQSQQPVTDASKIMTNVARMRLRNSGRI